MKLKMMIGNQLIAITELDPSRIKSDGYVQSLQDSMAKKYATLLEYEKKRPTFYIEVAAGNN